LELSGLGAVALAQVPLPSSSLLPVLVVGWFRLGTSKAYPFGRFVAVGGCWVVLIGYRGALTPLVPSVVALEDGCHLPLMNLRQKSAQFCAGPTTTTPKDAVSLPGGVVVRSRGMSSFFLAIALRRIVRRALLGILVISAGLPRRCWVGCWILVVTREISVLRSSSSLADWEDGSSSFS
jgi:hypothetical protein